MPASAITYSMEVAPNPFLSTDVSVMSNNRSRVACPFPFDRSKHISVVTGNAETIIDDAGKTDRQVADAFGERMVDVLNSGARALMLSIGHRTGLFDTMAGMAPAYGGDHCRPG